MWYSKAPRASVGEEGNVETRGEGKVIRVGVRGNGDGGDDLPPLAEDEAVNYEMEAIS